MTNIPPDEDNEQHTCESPEDASHDDELTPEVLSAAKEIIEDNPVDIEISSLRIFSMDKILDHIINTLSAATAEISSVSLRKNLIHEITDIPTDIRHIQSFDLYDNKIRRIQRLDNFGPSLKVLDLSYNQIKKIEGLDALCNLEQLYLVENRIQVIQGLSSLQRLRLLELGGNRIRHIDENSFEGLGELRELYLGKNKIECLQHLTSLVNLERISLQANRLTQCETGFETNHALKEVYLSENGINHIGQAIKHLSYLELLDFSFNPIASLSGLDDLACTKQLKEFWLTDGKIEDWSEVVRLQKFQSLHTVYLERNPIERDKRYRCKVYQELPWIHQIDSWPIVNRKNPETDRARDPRFASSE